jgi:hypothetical protein
LAVFKFFSKYPNYLISKLPETMFEHFLAGEIIFLVLGKALGFEITPSFLLFGSFCGFLPDVFSYFLNKRIRYDKWYHSHRDNFSHSIFFALTVFAALAFPFGWKIALLVSLAVLSHPLLDLYGLGWGVKLFLPISDDIYKILFKKKFIYVYEDDRERNHDVEKFQTDDWFQRVYLMFFRKKKQSLGQKLAHRSHGVQWRSYFQGLDSAPKWWGLFEWFSLILAIYLPLLYFLKNHYF